MFKETRNIYKSMRNSGITVFGSILYAGLMLILSPLFWFEDKRLEKDFGKFNRNDLE